MWELERGDEIQNQSTAKTERKRKKKVQLKQIRFKNEHLPKILRH